MNPTEPAAQPPDAPASVDHNRVFAQARELVAIKREADGLTERLDKLKARRSVIEAELMEAFANEPGLGRLRIDGYTIYLRRQLWANATDKAAAYEALIAAGLSDYALRTFNVQSVSALYREWDKNGEQPPSELAGIITATDTYQIGMTRS